MNTTRSLANRSPIASGGLAKREWADGPDEPAHIARCPDCHGFLPATGWAYEPIAEERIIAWYTHCAKCGGMVTHEN